MLLASSFWLAITIFVVTIVFVIWQPRGLNIAWSASAGALLALLYGVISLSDIPLVWSIVWNATATLIAIIVSTLLLDEAGFSNGQRFTWRVGDVVRDFGFSSTSFSWEQSLPRFLPTTVQCSF